MIHLIIIWALIILFIIQPGVAHYGAEEGLKLFTTALLPYLLPYIILTQWAVKSSKGAYHFTWQRYVKAYVLGSFGGFPVGAVTISEMKKKNELSKQQSELLLAVCHAPGPMFILGFIGTDLFGNIQVGWKLLFVIHFANLLFLFIYFLLGRKSLNEPISAAVSKDRHISSSPLLDAIKQSSEVIILVATTVIFFSALGIVLANLVATTFSADTGITQTALLAVFEMTAGVQSASVHFNSFSYFPFLIALVVSLNGISIHMQIAVIARAANLSIRLYMLARLWNIILVPFLFYFLY